MLPLVARCSRPRFVHTTPSASKLSFGQRRGRNVGTGQCPMDPDLENSHSVTDTKLRQDTYEKTSFSVNSDDDDEDDDGDDDHNRATACTSPTAIALRIMWNAAMVQKKNHSFLKTPRPMSSSSNNPISMNPASSSPELLKPMGEADQPAIQPSLRI